MPQTHTLTPVPTARTRSAVSFDELGSFDPPPTVRVAPPSPPPPPATAVFPPSQSLALTPPPAGNLSRARFSASVPSAELAATMPAPGETFHGFQLVNELGRGTFARVFLARQEALADREVALKVTLKETREADRLARLQHTNIVPVYSVHTAKPVHLICMPFLGRRTLADLLTGFRKSHLAPGHSTRKALLTRKGSSAVSGTRSKTAFADQPSGRHPRPTEAGTPAPAADPLIGDVPAVLRVIGQLADGLAHAHGRGILHLDLKPANVLFADTGEPMLLDFNLSFDATEADRELVGGTIPYMAPEQLLDLRTRGKGRIDARTDLYALGVIAFELLTGSHPFAFAAKSLAEFEGMMAVRKKGPPPVRDFNPAVSPAVDAIVRKLLAPEPADRYQSAADLREDVDRQLADRPLRFAADRSVGERIGKWRRRNPRAVVLAALAAAVSLACAAGAIAYSETQKVAASEAKDRIAQTRAVLDPIRLDLVLPGDAKARARGTARALEQLRAYGLPVDPNWQQRTTFRQVPAESRAAVAADLGELLLLVAHARWDDGKAPDKKEAAAEALALNKLAEGCFPEGVPPFLIRQRIALEAASGLLPAPGDPGRPATARDHFLDAVGLMAANKVGPAMKDLEQVVAEQPSHAAAHFFVGWCRLQNRDYMRAVERFGTAREQMPTDPRPMYYTGLAYLRQNNKLAEADGEFTRAIRLDPGSAEAYRNRGFVRLKSGRNRDAEHDLTEALARGASPVQVYPLRADIRDGLGDAAGAAQDRAAIEASRPADEEDFLARGWYYLPQWPDRALADFRAAEAMNPKSLRAIQNQAHILDRYKGDAAGALVLMTKLAELYPASEGVRVDQAYLLVKAGRPDEARRLAEHIDKLTTDPKISYKFACLYSMLSNSNPADRGLAVAFLRQAFRNGYSDIEEARTDSDLDAIRTAPEFIELVRAAAEVYRGNEIAPE